MTFLNIRWQTVPSSRSCNAEARSLKRRRLLEMNSSAKRKVFLAVESGDGMSVMVQDRLAHCTPTDKAWTRYVRQWSPINASVTWHGFVDEDHRRHEQQHWTRCRGTMVDCSRPESKARYSNLLVNRTASFTTLQTAAPMLPAIKFSQAQLRARDVAAVWPHGRVKWASSSTPYLHRCIS